MCISLSHSLFDTVVRRSSTPDGTSPRALSNNNSNAPLPSLDPAAPQNSSRRIENGSVHVVVRSRPMNAVEKARGDQHLFRFSEPRDMQVVSASAGSGNRELVRSFQFDFCASEGLSQASFFRSSGAMALMDSVVEGYLATIFAYGQTGSGKTYVNAHTTRISPIVCYLFGRQQLTLTVCYLLTEHVRHRGIARQRPQESPRAR